MTYASERSGEGYNMMISIVVTIYNVSPYLEKCLNSLLKLGSRVGEIICINDGSSDNSTEIVSRYMEMDSRIQLINKKNCGVGSARNRGIELATGDYIAFVDGDDYILPDEFEKLLNEVEKSGFPDGVWTGYIRDDWNGLHTEDTKLNSGIMNNHMIREQYLPAVMGISYSTLYSWFRGTQTLNQKQEFPAVWRGLYSKKVIEEFHIKFNTKVTTGEDLLFNHWFYSYAKSLLVSNCNYYCYIWRKGSLTQDTDVKFYEAKKRFISERECQNRNLVEKGIEDASSYYQGTLVLTKIQMAVVLSKCKSTELSRNLRMFKSYPIT